MPRNPRLVLAALLAAVVATAGCTLPVFAPDSDGDVPGTAAGKAPPAVPGTQAQWTPCPEVPRQLVGRGASGMTYECASVAVPRDWAAPRSGQTYEVAMIRIRSRTQRDRIGSLLINPGGPGSSGIDMSVYLSFGQALGGLPTEITDRFDLVGFDPRGVHRSAPVKCISAADQDATFAAVPDPETDAEFQEIVALNKRVAVGCGDKYGAQLPFFSTEQAAHDMDAIRAAVGDAKTTYLGYSYGTLLGATYAQLYPGKVRALVLDGAVNPKQGFEAGSEAQAKGFERAFTNFTAWCKANAGKCPIAPDARGAVTDAMAKADASPVEGEDGRAATSGWIFYAVIASLYTEPGWQQLAKAVADLQGGDPSGIFDLADQYADRKPDGTYSNLFDANLAVNCADTDKAPTAERVRQLQSDWRKKYPLFGAPLAIGMLSCTFWPGAKDPYPAGPATGAPPIVVVGTTGDPATPYENTAELASMLGTGRVLTWEGEGHTAYPSTKCIVAAVDAYLIDLKVPAEGLRCPPQ
ncbi:alpha/beta hydrolase [Amorphoplanes digitatis]|uniref:Pimeloyl-ACP methyl ester carboxylesterase n=1 Tax=Actinoplanes digitatis TaxID=1868 RepID=A0A7W7HTM4_9ACTN|nr:alpha/beta hydrolase [Actinoplanes digitatis]MBB4760575.1 pimeloyl-ACP methyl ester carboxylesterase [Actinoplanes digitatis]GID97127.1 proteinase [Actinoplanes digitatis]